MFADDDAILASSKSGSERVVKEFQSAGKDYSLTVSVPKTKHLVTGREARDCD